MSEALSLRAALAVVNDATVSGAPLRIALACGFTPLHLQTFVHAYAARARPQRRIETRTGMYGDLTVAADELRAADPDVAIVLIEWPDLDPRLSIRSAGRAARPDDAQLLADVRAQVGRLESRLHAWTDDCPVVVALPAVALPPTFASRAGALSALEASLRSEVAQLAQRLAAVPGIRVVADEHPGFADGRADLRSQLRADFPYTARFASVLARDVVALALPAAAFKGLITDLDDTLWRGLVGEVGPDGVDWSLEHDAAHHAVYQQVLADLAASGVLIGVATKNDVQIVSAALARPDLGVPADALHPVEAGWEPKSQSVTRILRAWNISAADVVVVDDNPMELAEIAGVHPSITTRLFPARSAAGAIQLITELRDLFWRDTASSDDALRAASLRSGATFEAEQPAAGDREDFLRGLDGLLTIDLDAASGARPYELAQKTNQFNLNGRRHEPAEWRRLGQRDGAVVASGAYRDRFGDLGTISTLVGTRDGSTLRVEAWVLSCRAFSRGIEQQLLVALAERLRVDRLVLDWASTGRNTVTADFLAAVLGTAPEPGVSIEVETIRTAVPSDLHRVEFTRRAPARRVRRSEMTETVDARQRVIDCFRTVFPAMQAADVPQATRAGDDAWDSLATLSLITVVEEEFGLVLDDDVVDTLDSFDAVVAAVEHGLAP